MVLQHGALCTFVRTAIYFNIENRESYLLVNLFNRPEKCYFYVLGIFLYTVNLLILEPFCYARHFLYLVYDRLFLHDDIFLT